MKSILIADSGSTKVEWAAIYPGLSSPILLKTRGLNGAMVSQNLASEYFLFVKNELPQDFLPDEIHYYGAGCGTPKVCELIGEAIENIWPNTFINVQSDLLGAARALLENKPGIVAILGTGSNSALYDGSKITANIPPLGYILGDEGSGTSLGKKLLGDIFKSIAPDDISVLFFSKYNLNLSDLIENTYRKPGANSYIASFVPFIAENIDHPYIKSIVKDSFYSFFERNITPYNSSNLPINFIGSIATIFSDTLKDVAEVLGYEVDKIIARPLDGLIKYHKKI